MSDFVDLPDAPEIPGLRFRPFRGPEDLPGIQSVHRGREIHDRVDPLSDQRTPALDELAEVYAPRPDFDPARQVLIAEVSGSIVGYQWIRSWAQADGSWTLYHRGLLLPEWRGKGIGTALLGWAETVLGMAALFRPSGVVARFVTAVTTDERETVTRLEAAGYAVENTVIEMQLVNLMTIEPPPALANFEIRRPRENELRAAFFALEAAFADEWGYVEKTDEDFANRMSKPETDPSLWYAAWQNDEIAGVVIAEANPPVGVIADLSVGKPWRRRGLGRALLLHGLHALRERGLTQARLYADVGDQFGARHLYESVGFTPLKEIRRYTKPAPK
ncbi:MAG: GNAT family N-acetyltransferase [Chloroflexota bacterium]|nr:MAG: hypothetical protein DIU68_10235 [Chloroflexota bacterium]